MRSTFKNNLRINYRQLSIKYFGVLFLFAAVLQGCIITQPASHVEYREVAPPQWAPPYQNPNRVQYYYMPDIEVYYDVWNHEFVYLENGNWVFEPELPPMYEGYDLYAGHVVVLDYHVHEPWRHHELYSSHYPKYYHHSVYPGNNGEYSTGFDENTNQHYYGPRTNTSSPSENHPRTNASSPNENGPRTNSPAPSKGRNNVAPTHEPRNNSISSPKEYENNKPEKQEQMGHPRKTQPVQYKEKNVGQPVKVQKNMTRPKNAGEPKRENKK